MVSCRLLTLLSIAPLCYAADLRVRILDGRSSQPLAHQHGVVLGDGSPALQVQFTTGDSGEFTFDPHRASAFRVFVEGNALCVPRHSHSEVSVQAVQSTGVINPDACSKIALPQPTPGVLVLFVRKKSFAEKMAD